MTSLSGNTAAALGTAILAMQARSLIVILEELAEADGFRDGHSNEPDSLSQKRWACLRSLGMHIDALEVAARSKETDIRPASVDAEPAQSGMDRTILTRQAVANLLLAASELNGEFGQSDAACALTEKALAAIGALRVIGNDGRVQP